jgi:hypothetical protein
MQVHGAWAAGAVVVLPASHAGLSLNETLISQSSRGVPGTSEAGDTFGSSVASGDFDRDGYADLAIGAPEEMIGRDPNGIFEAGGVTVVYGSARGLDTARSVFIGRPGGPAAGAHWGSSLVTGDFNVDGYPDLAVAATEDHLPGPNSTGAVGIVRILPGSAGGIRSTGVRALGPQTGTSQAHEQFGAALAAGDLDGDGDTELVVGASGYNPARDGWFNGSVSYCPGTAGGPTACRLLARGERYGGLSEIAVGNMSGGRLPEIAVGVPFTGSDSEVIDAVGRVQVLELSPGPPITVAHRNTIRQSSVGVPGVDEVGDHFGSSVALRDLDRDGYADLVVGASGENDYRGRVAVVHGGSTGWRTSGNCTYSQDTPGIPGVGEAFDFFGERIALFDHDGDGHLDLTVGAPGENPNTLDEEGGSAGVISTLRGSVGCGFTTAGSNTFGLVKLGYRNQPNASFGSVLGRRN